MKNEYLIHYGVKGMKWGVRKKKPKAKTMTTKDLKTKTDRMRLERDYNALTKKKRNRAKLIGASVVTAIATTAVSVAVRKYTSKGLDALDGLRTARTTADFIWDLPVSDLKNAFR